MTVPAIRERSAALVLAPALLIAMLSLAMIAVDLSALHQAHRSIHRVAATAADDAAGIIDGHHLQQTGAARIDRDAATRLVALHVERALVPGTVVGQPLVTFDEAASRVTVQLSVDIDHIVAGSVMPGGATSRLVVTASARMVP